MYICALTDRLKGYLKMQTIVLSIAIFFSFNQTKERIALKTHSGDNVIISKGIIYFNQKPISKTIEGIVYSGKYNRLIEQHSSILLFLEIGNSPNFNELMVFKVTPKKVIQLAECVYNDKSQGIGPAPFTDMDNDGKLEFGGFGLTEFYNSKDSMYYNPSEYFQISNSTVVFDSILTKKMDIKVNGIYLKRPLDKEGNCCLVIKKPINKNSH